MTPQKTIAKPAEISGKGLFTGGDALLRFKPAPENSGIHFIRVDQVEPVRIAADIENVSKRARRTALKNGTLSIETVEHCLAAISGLGIDNVDIELVGDEVPAVDGSCRPFVDIIQAAGIREQHALRHAAVIPEMIRVTEGDSELVALPPLREDSQSLEIFYDLDYGEAKPIGRQTLGFTLTAHDFIEKIAPARTFVLKHEADALRAAGLGSHLTFSDVLVFGEDGPIDNELRFPDECVRHKILDLIGDLMLFGRPIIGRVHARKSGHALNHQLVRAIRNAFERRARQEVLLKAPKLNIHHIQRILPHRYPLLMLDRIIEIDGTRRAVGIKNVTINEEYFQGHYPGQPIMPGVLIIESMAQLGGVLLSQRLEHRGKIAVLLALDKVKFRHPVMPGDQLVITAESVSVGSRSGHVRCRAEVGSKRVAEASIKFVLRDQDPLEDPVESGD